MVSRLDNCRHSMLFGDDCTDQLHEIKNSDTHWMCHVSTKVNIGTMHMLFREPISWWTWTSKQILRILANFAATSCWTIEFQIYNCTHKSSMSCSSHRHEEPDEGLDSISTSEKLQFSYTFGNSQDSHCLVVDQRQLLFSPNRQEETLLFP